MAIDINVKVCFRSSVEINPQGLREIYPALSLGCFIRKPVSIDYLITRITSELDLHQLLLETWNALRRNGCLETVVVEIWQTPGQRDSRYRCTYVVIVYTGIVNIMFITQYLNV